MLRNILALVLIIGSIVSIGLVSGATVFNRTEKSIVTSPTPMAQGDVDIQPLSFDTGRGQWKIRWTFRAVDAELPLKGIDWFDGVPEFGHLAATNVNTLDTWGAPGQPIVMIVRFTDHRDRTSYVKFDEPGYVPPPRP